jgi:hypothetical protein
MSPDNSHELLRSLTLAAADAHVAHAHRPHALHYLLWLQAMQLATMLVLVAGEACWQALVAGAAGFFVTGILFAVAFVTLLRAERFDVLCSWRIRLDKEHRA